MEVVTDQNQHELKKDEICSSCGQLPHGYLIRDGMGGSICNRCFHQRRFGILVSENGENKRRFQR